MRRQAIKHPDSRQRVVLYSSCPECNASISVQANGRIVRHSFGFGYVERVNRLTRTRICKGSGRKIHTAAELRELDVKGKLYD
jgi:hypothetical protein